MIISIQPVDLIPLWPLAFVLIWAIWNIARDSRDEKLVERSLGWPEAQAIVVASSVVWAHVEVKYEYLVKGTRYSGTYKMNLPVGPPDRYARTATRVSNEAKADLADYPPDTRVIIRYNPKDPKQSVLYCLGEINKDKPSEDVGETPKFITLS